jgi:hypothetical protein
MNDLFNAAEIPFNLAGELIDNSTTSEGESRVRALAESEARKAQLVFLSDDDARNANDFRQRVQIIE